MSCTPGESSASNQRIGRRRLVTKASPTRGNSRFTQILVCSALAYSPTSPATNANRSATWPPSTSTTRKLPPVGTWTARASRAGTSTNSSTMRRLSMPQGEGGGGGPSFPFMPGSRFGARSIREHSLRFLTDGRGYYDPQARRRFLEREMVEGRIADVGDADVLPTNVVDTFANITALTRKVVERGALPVALGADHAITYPVVRAFEGEEPFHVVHFDAHIDYMPFVHGLEFTNQHAFRHLRLMPNVRSINQVGIRSIRNTQVMHEDSLRDGNRVVTMEEFRDRPVDSVLDGIPEGARCYISVDIDVLDMSLIPGCVSAEP